jgi:hypothetical protein
MHVSYSNPVVDRHQGVVMKILKSLGLVFIVTLAFGTMGAAPASALLFLTLLSLELFTVEGLTTVILATKAHEVLCENVRPVLGHGFLLNRTDIAEKILLTFHKCSTPLAACNSAGEPKGLITTLELDALLVTLLKATADKYGLKLLAEKGNIAEFTCGLENVTVRGSVVGEFEETLAESEAQKASVKLLFSSNGHPGEPAIKDYETLTGVGTAQLIANFGVADEEASLEMLVDVTPLHPVAFCHK